jgi:serine phosphatase RsbU (regulator of sigma subunit)
LALDRSDGPAAILDRLDKINIQLGITPFATLLFATLTRAAGGWSMRWASAGHPPPLLLTPCGVQLLERVSGTALVTTRTPARGEAQINVAAGSTLLFYTDGLIERRGRDLTDNLNAFVARAAASEHSLLEPLCEDLLADAPTDDDIAMLAIQVAEGQPSLLGELAK